MCLDMGPYRRRDQAESAVYRRMQRATRESRLALLRRERGVDIRWRRDPDSLSEFYYAALGPHAVEVMAAEDGSYELWSEDAHWVAGSFPTLREAKAAGKRALDQLVRQTCEDASRLHL